MKVLLLNITGRFGSTGRIVNDIREYLIAKGHDAIIVHGHPDSVNDSAFYQIDNPLEAKIVSQLAKLGRAQYKGNPFALKRLKLIINHYCPDVIHIHCINGQMINIYRLFKYLSHNRYKTVVTHHAEFFYTGSCAYSYDCTKFIVGQCKRCPMPRLSTVNKMFIDNHNGWVRMFNAVNGFNKDDICFAAVSPWVYERALKSPIVNSYQSKIVLNGINTNIFHYKECRLPINNKIKNLNARVVLHVTHQFASNDNEGIKGGGFVTKLAKIMPDITFIVVASDVIDVSDVPSNMYIWGRTDSQEELAQLYSFADVTLLTSKRETFSMVVAESLCCGTPIVGFNAGGPESIAVKEFSSFIEYGNLGILEQAVKKFLVMDVDKRYISDKCIPLYSKERMGEQYLSIYNKLSMSLLG